MKRILAVSLIVVSCLIISACSRAAEFVVINQSDSIIEVEYTLNSNLKSLDNPTTIPLKMQLSNWNPWFGRFRQKEWQETPQSEFSYDSETQKCKLKLASNEVLRITFVDYDDFRSTNEFQNFKVVNLRMNGKYGEVSYNGNQIYNQFEKKDSQNYYISYKQLNTNERGN